MLPLLASLVLTLAPWTGPSLPTATASAAKFRLDVRGSANQQVELQAHGLPAGWIASFCTRDLCSPYRYAMRLDSRGRGTLEFQAVRVDPSVPARARVVVSAGGGAQAAADVRAP